jgi:hypothetical protein
VCCLLCALLALCFDLILCATLLVQILDIFQTIQGVGEIVLDFGNNLDKLNKFLNSFSASVTEQYRS